MQDRNFRSVPTVGFPEGVFEDPRNPLTLINTEGMSFYANSVEQKREILQQYSDFIYKDEDDLLPNLMLLFAWQGKFKTDMFEVKKDQAIKLLDGLNPRTTL